MHTVLLKSFEGSTLHCRFAEGQIAEGTRSNSLECDGPRFLARVTAICGGNAASMLVGCQRPTIASVQTALFRDPPSP